MKKWWLHTFSCVCNAVTATIILIFFFYEIINDNAAFTFTDGLGVFVMLLGYSIYLISDVWGLKLYYRVINLDSVSFTDKGKVQVLLFFLALVQIFMGYVTYNIIRRLILDFPSGYESVNGLWSILRYLILIVFFTAAMVFTGYIFLLRAINKNKRIIKEEIENIGKTDF
jgi:hypothetical protein